MRNCFSRYGDQVFATFYICYICCVSVRDSVVTPPLCNACCPMKKRPLYSCHIIDLIIQPEARRCLIESHKTYLHPSLVKILMASLTAVWSTGHWIADGYGRWWRLRATPVTYAAALRDKDSSMIHKHHSTLQCRLPREWNIIQVPAQFCSKWIQSKKISKSLGPTKP